VQLHRMILVLSATPAAGLGLGPTRVSITRRA
jgi:hypothetical protein